MDISWTNGFIEKCNNKTKALKRVCFGMCNFPNIKKNSLVIYNNRAGAFTPTRSIIYYALKIIILRKNP